MSQKFSLNDVKTSFQNGVIFALKSEKSDQFISNLLSKTKYALSRQAIQERRQKLDNDENMIYDPKIKNRGRKQALTKQEGDEIVKKVKLDRKLTAKAIARDTEINEKGQFKSKKGQKNLLFN
ncbi:hypothetical protein ABPG72_021757 [Tetrahymena utriculariae]